MMARITLSSGFTLLPEGEHTFIITEVEYKEDFGKLTLKLRTADGSRHNENFNLLKSDGSPNEGAINAFSYLAKVAMNDFSLTEIDHNDLIGKYFGAMVVHNVVPARDKPDETITFVNLTEKFAAEPFEYESELDSILGGN